MTDHTRPEETSTVPGADERDLAVELGGGVDDLLDAVDVRREARHDDAPVAVREGALEVGAHERLAGGDAGPVRASATAPLIITIPAHVIPTSHWAPPLALRLTLRAPRAESRGDIRAEPGGSSPASLPPHRAKNARRGPRLGERRSPRTALRVTTSPKFSQRAA